jgi:uncharacterized membrane protein
MPFCPYCGKEVSAEAAFCPSCGSALKVLKPQYARYERSASITIASILFFIAGILEFIGGIILMGGGALFAKIPLIGWIFGPLIAIVGVIVLIASLLDLCAGTLLWDNKKSGGILGIVSSILGLMVGLITFPLGLLDIALSLILIILIAVGWSTLKD